MYDAIIYKARNGRTLTIKWPPVPHPWPSALKSFGSFVLHTFTKKCRALRISTKNVTCEAVS